MNTETLFNRENTHYSYSVFCTKRIWVTKFELHYNISTIPLLFFPSRDELSYSILFDHGNTCILLEFFLYT